MTSIQAIEFSNGATEYLLERELELQSLASNPLSPDLRNVAEQGVRVFETCIYMANLGDFVSEDYYHPVKGIPDCSFSEYNFNKLHLVPLVECSAGDDKLVCALAQGFKFMEALRNRLPDTDHPVDMAISCNHENEEIELRSCVFRLYQSRSQEHQWPQAGDTEGQSYFESFVLVVRFAADASAEPVDVFSAVMAEAKRRAGG